MKRLLLFLLLFCGAVLAQPSNPAIILVAVAPSGSCAVQLPDEQVITTGALYSCQSGTWTQFAQGSGGTVPTSANVIGSNASSQLISASDIMVLCASQSATYLYSVCYAGTHWTDRVTAASAVLPVLGGIVDTTGDTNDVGTTTAALTNSTHLIVAQGTWTTSASPGVSIAGGGSTIEGRGQFVSIIKCTNTSGHCIYGDMNVNNAGLQLNIRYLGVYDGVSGAGRSAGDGIHLDSSNLPSSGNNKITLSDIYIANSAGGTNHGFNNGVVVVAPITTTIQRVTSLYAILDAFQTTSAGTSTTFFDTYGSHPGQYCYELDGSPRYMGFTNTACDTAGSHGYYLSGASGAADAAIIFSGAGAEVPTGSCIYLDSAYAVTISSFFCLQPGSNGITTAATTQNVQDVTIEDSYFYNGTGYALSVPTATGKRPIIYSNNFTQSMSSCANGSTCINDPDGVVQLNQAMFTPPWLLFTGNGSGGANTTASGNMSGELYYTNFTVPFGNTVTVNSFHSLTIHATGTCVIAGTINARGLDSSQSSGLGGGSSGSSGGGAAAGTAGNLNRLYYNTISGLVTAAVAGGTSGGSGNAASALNGGGINSPWLNGGAGGLDGQYIGGAAGVAGGSSGGAAGSGGGGVTLICGEITGTDGTHTGIIDAEGNAGAPPAASSTGGGSGGGGGAVILSSILPVTTWPTVFTGGGAGQFCTQGYGATCTSGIVVPDAVPSAQNACTTTPILTLTGCSGALSTCTCTVSTAGAGCGASPTTVFSILGGGGTQGTGTVNPTWSGGAVASCTLTTGTSSGYTTATYTTAGAGGPGAVGFYAEYANGAQIH